MMAPQAEDSPSTPQSESWLLLLPDHLLQRIMERLSLADYATFGSVCRRWRSIVYDHLRLHAPSPTAAKQHPWLFHCHPDQEFVLCLDPFSSNDVECRQQGVVPSSSLQPRCQFCTAVLEKSQQQQPPPRHSHHRLMIPFSARHLDQHQIGKPERRRSWVCYSSLPNGWLLLDDKLLHTSDPDGHTYYLTLLNPLTGDQIALPRIKCDMLGLMWHLNVAGSFSCVLNTVVLLSVRKGPVARFVLFRTNEEFDWHWLENEEEDGNTYLIGNPIFWRGKFYCWHARFGLLVVDPFSKNPRLQNLNMDQETLETDYINTLGHLVEFDGRVLLVAENYGYDRTPTNLFKVFEIDMEGRRWLKVETLGDQVMVLFGQFIRCMLGTDIGVEEDHIYYVDTYKTAYPRSWEKFSMITGEISNASLGFAPSPGWYCMFAPKK